MLYCYVCDCGATPERNVPCDDRNDQRCDRCGSPLRRDLATEMKGKQLRVPLGFKWTASDFEPPEIQGLSAVEKARTDYANETYFSRWV